MLLPVLAMACLWRARQAPHPRSWFRRRQACQDLGPVRRLWRRRPRSLNPQGDILMHFKTSIALAAVVFAHVAAPSAGAETLAELAQHTHYHGIAFARS